MRFEFLHPPAGASAARRNNQSCVLRIATLGASMLLTGDIEKSAEEELMKSAFLKSDIVLVPHHGSRSSSSPAFVAAVQPRYAIVPVGYRNRFGHPVPEVLARYGAAGVRLLRTDADGAILVKLDGNAPVLDAERRRRGRYWLQ